MRSGSESFVAGSVIAPSASPLMANANIGQRTVSSSSWIFSLNASPGARRSLSLKGRAPFHFTRHLAQTTTAPIAKAQGTNPITCQNDIAAIVAETELRFEKERDSWTARNQSEARFYRDRLWKASGRRKFHKPLEGRIVGGDCKICLRQTSESTSGGIMNTGKLAFEMKPVRLALTDVLPVRLIKDPQSNIERYRTICTSIKEVGMIEPLVVYPQKGSTEKYLLLDGHLRLFALKELGHLMQAIARVNRVFKDKPGGLVVDYIGIAAELKKALRICTDAKGKGQPTLDAEEALSILLEKMDVVRGMFHGLDYSKFETEALKLLVPAANHLLGLKHGKQRFLDVMASVTKAYSLCGTLDEAAVLRTEIAFFSAIKAVLLKHTSVDRKQTEDEKNSALKQILDNAIIAEGVSDIFALAGLEKPNIGLLSDEFLEDVRSTPMKNLAAELLERLLRDEIRSHTRGNLVQQKKYTDLLLETLRKYHNRAIETTQVIEALIEVAKDFQSALKRHESLNLNPDEVAFYDALAERPEVLQQMGDATLKKLATELTAKLRESTTVDWQVRESVRAKMRLLIKRLLRKYKYPPKGQEAAVTLVLEQAEALADGWSAAK